MVCSRCWDNICCCCHQQLDRLSFRFSPRQNNFAPHLLGSGLNPWRVFWMKNRVSKGGSSGIERMMGLITLSHVVSLCGATDRARACQQYYPGSIPSTVQFLIRINRKMIYALTFRIHSDFYALRIALPPLPFRRWEMRKVCKLVSRVITCAHRRTHKVYNRKIQSFF